MARGRASVDWNHAVKPAKDNTRTFQMPFQAGGGARREGRGAGEEVLKGEVRKGRWHL